MSRNFLSMNEEFRKGDFLISNNGEYKAIFQNDGNFVVYGWAPVWATNTYGLPGIDRLVMQHDCNLVIYTPCKPVWASNTYCTNATICRLTLGDDGILVIHKDGDAVWKSTKRN